MTDQTETPEAGSRPDFEEAAKAAPPGFIREYVSFMKSEKKWWLAPLLLALLVAGVFIVLSATAAGPFIYALF